MSQCPVHSPLRGMRGPKGGFSPLRASESKNDQMLKLWVFPTRRRGGIAYSATSDFCCCVLFSGFRFLVAISDAQAAVLLFDGEPGEPTSEKKRNPIERFTPQADRSSTDISSAGRSSTDRSSTPQPAVVRCRAGSVQVQIQRRKHVLDNAGFIGFPPGNMGWITQIRNLSSPRDLDHEVCMICGWSVRCVKTRCLMPP